MSYPLERLVARDLANRDDTLRQLTAIVGAQLAVRPPLAPAAMPVSDALAPQFASNTTTEPRLRAARA